MMRREWRRAGSLFLLVASALLTAQAASSAQLQNDAEAAASSGVSLELGEIRSLPVEEITRIAVGDPDIADVTILSLNEILLQGKGAGQTNLIVWDRQGRHVVTVSVVDHALESAEIELRRLVDDLHLERVQIKREGGRLFLTGITDTQAQLDQIEQLLSAYGKDVTNLVALSSLPPPPAMPPDSVKLTVQLIEMNRDATNKLGVDWADALTFTETTFGVKGPANVSLSERVENAFRLGSLSRTTGDAKTILNMLIQQGKARMLAEPKLVAASGKEATAFLGVEKPILSATNVSSGTVTQNIEFKKTGVELKFQPTVLPSGAIQLVIDAKVSSIDTASAITVQGVSVPGFKVRQTQTEIVTGSGKSVFIAGLLQDEEKKNLNQLPALGSIPVLGNLFRSTEFIRGQTELIIVVTPEVSEQPDAARRSGEEAIDQSIAVEEALTNAEIVVPPEASVSSVPDDMLRIEDPRIQYALSVQQRIAGALRYPERAGVGWEPAGTVTLTLHLFPDGTLQQAAITESSGIEALDQAAVDAANAQAPFPSFPSQLVEKELWLRIPVVFRP